MTSPSTDGKNKLYYGDNLDVLRRHVADKTVDLAYLDPPFNSNANYNVLSSEKGGTQAASQFHAFNQTAMGDADRPVTFGCAPAWQLAVALFGIPPQLAWLQAGSSQGTIVNHAVTNDVVVWYHDCYPWRRLGI